MTHAFFLFLAACYTETAPVEAPVGAAARAGGGYVLEADPLVAGETSEVRVLGAPPGALVRFFHSKAGTGAGPCHPVRGVCTELLAPILPVGEAFADAAGTARTLITLPETVPSDAYLQAFVVMPSNLLIAPIAAPDTGLDTADTATADTAAPIRRLDGVVSATDAEAKLVGESADDYASGFIGNSLAFAGDVNGDGFGDLLIGAPFNDSNILSAEIGRAYLQYGPMSGSLDLSTADVIFDPTMPHDHEIGRNVAGLRDLNGDGFDDIAIGSPLTNINLIADTGATYVFYGGALSGVTSTATADATIYGPWMQGWGNIGNLGDLDGDGADDLLTIAEGIATKGRVYLLSGAPVGSLDAAATAVTQIKGVGPGDLCITLPEHPLDFDGDGANDLLIGCEADDAGALNGGSARLFLGPLPGGNYDTTVADLTLYGDAGTAAGTSVDAGDLDGDGYGDIVVGAPSLAVDVGFAYVAFGPTLGTETLSTDADITWVGDTFWSGAGRRVRAVGDLDGDSHQDVVVADTEDNGTMYLLYGPVTAGTWNLADVTDRIVGEAPGDGIGWNVSSGDIDGDGQLDLLAGSHNDIGGPSAGAAYVFLGGVL